MNSENEVTKKLENNRKHDIQKNPILKTNDRKLHDKLTKVFLKQKIRRQALSTLNRYATSQVSQVELEDHEHMLQFRQEHLKPLLSVQNQSQVYKLELFPGEFVLDYSNNGRNLLLSGTSGQTALLDWKHKNLLCELQLKEPVRACKFMHLNFFALAQKNNCFIYDFQGLEVQQLDNVIEPMHLEYLPYHYLLTSLTKWGKLIFTDASIGQTVAEIKTKIQNVQ